MKKQLIIVLFLILFIITEVEGSYIAMGLDFFIPERPYQVEINNSTYHFSDKSSVVLTGLINITLNYNNIMLFGMLGWGYTDPPEVFDVEGVDFIESFKDQIYSIIKADVGYTFDFRDSPQSSGFALTPTLGYESSKYTLEYMFREEDDEIISEYIRNNDFFDFSLIPEYRFNYDGVPGSTLDDYLSIGIDGSVFYDYNRDKIGYQCGIFMTFLGIPEDGISMKATFLINICDSISTVPLYATAGLGAVIAF